MWKDDVVNKVKAIYDGKSGTKQEQMLIHDYCMFYGETDEIGNPHYGIRYETVMKMLSGERHNPYIWIVYEGIHNESECIYLKTYRP